MVEPEFALEFLVLLFERPALMDQAHERAQGGGRGQIDEVVLDARLGSGLPFAEQPDLGGEAPRVPPMGGVTRTAAKRPPRVGFEPLRHVTRRQAVVGSVVARVRTATGVYRASTRGRVRGRPRPRRGRGWTRGGRPRKTVRCDDTPTA